MGDLIKYLFIVTMQEIVMYAWNWGMKIKDLFFSAHEKPKLYRQIRKAETTKLGEELLRNSVSLLHHIKDISWGDGSISLLFQDSLSLRKLDVFWQVDSSFTEIGKYLRRLCILGILCLATVVLRMSFYYLNVIILYFL